MTDADDLFTGQFEYDGEGLEGVALQREVAGWYVAQPDGRGITRLPRRPSNVLLLSTSISRAPGIGAAQPGRGEFEVVIIFDDSTPTLMQMDEIWVFFDGGVLYGYSNVGVFELARNVKAGVLRLHLAK